MLSAKYKEASMRFLLKQFQCVGVPQACFPGTGITVSIKAVFYNILCAVKL